MSDSLEVMLARLETKLDVALARGDDHEGRLRALERKIWQAAGVMSVTVGGGAAALTQILGK